MQNFHLSPDTNGWKLSSEGGELIVENFDTKEEAIEACSQFMGHRIGSLKIHRADGTFEEERTYPRAMDPVRSPG